MTSLTSFSLSFQTWLRGLWPLCLGTAWLLLLFSAADVALGQTAATWRFVKLDLDVAIDPATGQMTVSGEGELDLVAESTDEVVFEIGGSWPTMSYASLVVEGARTTINKIDPSRKHVRLGVAHFDRDQRRGSRAPFRFELQKLKNTFPLAVDARAAVALSGAGWYPLPAGERAASDALPPGTIKFTLPKGWHVVTNGSLVESRTSGSTTTEIYRAGRNHARDFIAAPYKVHRLGSTQGANQLYLLDVPVSPKQLLTEFGKAQMFLTARYGASPYDSYAIAELPNDLVPWYGASAEGFIILRNVMMRSNEELLNNLVHELAHSWWGTALTPFGPGSYLLSEGMASFSGNVFWEAEFGRETAIDILDFGTPSSAPDATTRGYFDLVRAGKDVALADLRSDRGDDYNIAQSKGVWVLRMLRDRLGDERFFEELRRYLEADEPTLEGFRRVFAEKDDSLQAFFSQWLDRSGVPVLDADWNASGNESHPIAGVRIVQKQATPYDLPLEIRLLTRKGVARRTLHLTGRETKVEFDVPGEVVGMTIDPDRKILMWRPEYGEQPRSPSGEEQESGG